MLCGLRRAYVAILIKVEKREIRGYSEAILSAASFGTIPLFSVPVLAAGMNLPSLLVYRFGFGCLFMLAILLFNGHHLHIRWGDALRLSFMALLYAASAVCLITGYSYMPSGIATTLLFSYPVWTALLMLVFFHQKLTWQTAVAIVLAFSGVFLLSGVGRGGGITSAVGLVLELLSGLAYAVYMVTFPRMRVSKIPSLKVNFYVFFMAMLMLLLYGAFTTGGLQPVGSGQNLVNLLLLGLLPTTVSNVSLIMALKLIDSTHVAILGAFEPLTAMLIGIFVFGEPFTVPIFIGFLLIIAAVVILVGK